MAEGTSGRAVGRYCVEHSKDCVSLDCCTWARCSHVPRCDIHLLVIGPKANTSRSVS